VFHTLVKHWLREALANGDQFDIAHQIMPQAARYPCPFRFFDIPYVVGPLGGALETPAGFKTEVGSAAGFTKLRALDSWRFRYDPWLRASYSRAACVVGVAPYVAEVLGDIPMRRFEPILELGIDALAPSVSHAQTQGQLKLLHVGRGVRTKGLRDVVRALAQLSDLPGITLTSAGAGEEIALCKAEAERLGVADRCTFLGRIEREAVENLYRTHDVFTFPSWREPAGGVLYEAMRWGLPVITAANGGPDWIIDDNCGVRLSVDSPEQLARDLATTVRALDADRQRLKNLGAGARTKVEREGLWPRKAEQLVSLYSDLI
jgi:glycosyltransferase involved in cell wall biosynthesis